MEKDVADKKKKSQTTVSVAHVAALVQMAIYAPDAFEQKSDVIMTYLVKRILMIPSPVNPVRGLAWTLRVIHLLTFLRTMKILKRNGLRMPMCQMNFEQRFWH